MRVVCIYSCPFDRYEFPHGWPLQLWDLKRSAGANWLTCSGQRHSGKRPHGQPAQKVTLGPSWSWDIPVGCKDILAIRIHQVMFDKEDKEEDLDEDLDYDSN